MSVYRVTLTTVASTTIDVEADDRDAAIDAAFDNAPGICARFSGWGRAAGIDLGDWDVAQEDGKDAEWAVEKVEVSR